MARNTKYFLSKRWRSIKLVWILFAAELAFTIPALALFAIAQPDLYRTKLWQDGFDNGFNSNPVDPIYAMVNRVPYKYPVVWSQFITDYNVVISVLSMFFLLVKGAMFIMHLFYPIFGVLVHGALTGLWAYTVWAQTQPDHSEPKHSALHAPWYIQKSCSVAHTRGNVGSCEQAKAALGVSVVMLFLFVANFALAVYSLIPTKAQRVARLTTVEEGDGKDSMRFEPPPVSAKQRNWEMQSLPPKTPKTPNTAMPLNMDMPAETPRTMAFNRLGSVGSGTSNDLPLRGR